MCGAGDVRYRYTCVYVCVERVYNGRTCHVYVSVWYVRVERVYNGRTCHVYVSVCGYVCVERVYNGRTCHVYVSVCGYVYVERVYNGSTCIIYMYIIRVKCTCVCVSRTFNQKRYSIIYKDV